MPMARRIGVLALLAGVALAGGCAPQTSYQTAVEAPKVNRVSFVRLAHEVTFAPGSAQLSEPEASRLAAFLRHRNVGYGDEVAIVSAAAPSDQTIARRQQQVVTAMLADLGLDVARASIVPADQATRGRVTVVVERHVVTPPACGYWSDDPTTNHSNLPSGNFGCATERNLGLMVADPADLLRGRSPSPADGAYATIGIQRYRLGETKPLTGSGTEASASGSGG